MTKVIIVNYAIGKQQIKKIPPFVSGNHLECFDLGKAADYLVDNRVELIVFINKLKINREQLLFVKKVRSIDQHQKILFISHFDMVKFIKHMKGKIEINQDVIEFFRKSCGEVTRMVPLQQSNHNLNKLSLKEINVLRLTSLGLCQKEIAKELYISNKTVQNHIYAIKNKLEVKTTVQAIILCIKNELF